MLKSWIVGFCWLLALPVQAQTILVLGDSISAAYGMETEQGWVSLLGRELARRAPDYRLVNASISGETSSGGRARLPELLARHRPAVVILELGGNDALRGTPLGAIRANLAELVRSAQAEGAEVLLLGMRIPPNYGPAYAEGFHQLYAQLAAEFGVARVPFLLQGVATDPAQMQADGIHPAAAAQPQLLANVWPQLQPLLSE